MKIKFTSDQKDQKVPDPKKNVPETKQKKGEEDDPFNTVVLASDYDQASPLGRLLFLFHWRFFYRNRGRDLKLSDIPKGRRVDGANYVYNEFMKYWNAEEARAQKNNRRPNLARAIFRQYGLELFVLGLFCFVAYFCMLYQALSLGDLIDNFNEMNADLLPEDKWVAKQKIIWVCLSILALSFIYTITTNVFNFFSWMISLRVRVCLSELIYRKSLKLSQRAFTKTSTGQIVNLLSTDMTRIDRFFALFPFPLVGVILFAYNVFRLWTYLRHYTLYGILFLALVMPVQILIGRIFSKMRMHAARYTDERIRLVDEFLNAIKIIKVYCWEHPFAERINEVRKKEIDIYKKSLYLFSVLIGMFTSTAKVIVFIIMATFYFTGGTITDKVAFLTLSSFNQTTFIITIYLPHFIRCLSNFMISVRRIDRFLSLDEKDNLEGNQNGNQNGNHPIDGDVVKEFDLVVNDLTACYTMIEGIGNPNFLDDSDKIAHENGDKLFYVLKNINFSCRPGELVIVVGPVGCGKSTLLQAILSEMQIKKGSIQVNGRLSYATQESWIFGGTIKENILFDSPFDPERYEEIIRVCALERDLTLFADSDQTQIGERGIALSGGQKARINLARALYREAEVYLLDDPLSAVDPHVAQHLFKNAISEYLKEKTVILVTHQLSFIRFADRVLFIKDGEQVLYEHSKRAMKQLIEEPDSKFARFVGDYSAQQQLKKRRDSSIAVADDLLSGEGMTMDPIVYDEDEEQNQMKDIKKQLKEKRILEEDDKVSFVAHAYLQYIKHGNGKILLPLLMLGFGLYQFFSTSCDFYLEIWTENVKIHDNSTQSVVDQPEGNLFKKILTGLIMEYDFYFYAWLVVALFFLAIIRTIFLSMFCMRASVSIHSSLFDRMVRAQMKFFYVNPVGVILNRFSRDIGVIDDQLVGLIFDSLDVIFNESVIVVVMAFLNVLLMIPFCLFAMITMVYRAFYLQTARSIETLEGVAKSPIIQHLTSTLNGLVTVRAFGSESKFIEKFHRFQNDHTAIHFMMVFVSGSLLVLALFTENVSGSMIGLIATYLLQFIVEFQWCIVSWSNLETYLCSVDRIERIGKNLDPSSTEESLCEPPLESSDDCKPPVDWPQRGLIQFRDVTMRYFANEPAVLKNLNFTINAGDKIGIVGRTGAGKSSILTALFRLTDYDGEIIIDGVSCKSIGLHDLRSNISIIPQESVLFTGTVRSNLDPLNEYEDHQLWNALRSVQLEQVVKDLDGCLDAKVMSDGSNFSVGQKQLICLARAILKNSRILVLDEATANTDPATDELIQATIRSVFSNCTILTIAHRINTIIDADRILVMDAGVAVEYDTPYRLLQDSSSLFSSMVDAYGEEQSKVLRKAAEDCELRNLS